MYFALIFQNNNNNNNSTFILRTLHIDIFKCARVTVVTLELQIIVEQISFQILLKGIQRSCRFEGIRKSIPETGTCYTERSIPIVGELATGNFQKQRRWRAEVSGRVMRMNQGCMIFWGFLMEAAICKCENFADFVYMKHDWTGNQWSDLRTGVMWSCFFVLVVFYI